MYLILQKIRSSYSNCDQPLLVTNYKEKQLIQRAYHSGTHLIELCFVKEHRNVCGIFHGVACYFIYKDKPNFNSDAAVSQLEISPLRAPVYDVS